MHDHISKSVYAPQLERWFAAFSHCQVYVTTFERFYTRGSDARDAAFSALLRWAGVPIEEMMPRSDRDVLLSERRNPTVNQRRVLLPSSYMLKLVAFFEPHNLKQAKLLGTGDVLQVWA